MNLKELIKTIATNEGLKVQVSVGNIREIVGIISDALYASGELGSNDLAVKLYSNGFRRSKRKKK